MSSIFDDPEFQQRLRELSIETGKPLSQVKAEAHSCLAEMKVPDGDPNLIGWDLFCRWLARAYKLDADAAAMERIKQLGEDHPLVFLPNHRSYLDPLILRSALAPHSFPPNHVLGGANLAMWPLASIAQRGGIVFIRRDTRDAPVYRAVLREYMSHLLNERANLEWYIEGGRTRTGKLRPPRYGILNYVIEGYARRPERDVFLIPTSIIYDQQHEVGAISAEDLGGTKEAESIAWLYRFARSQSRRLGRAHVRFGEPLSLREALAATESGSPDNPRLAVSKVAFEVCNRINAATPITPTALVTFALLDNDGRAITIDEGRSILQPLLSYMHTRGLPTTSDLDLTTTGGLAHALAALVREGVVQIFDRGTEPVFVIPIEEQHESAFYRNTIIHFFVNRAIGEIALAQACMADSADLPADTWANAKRLRDLMKFEFFFPRTVDFAADIDAEVRLIDPNWEQETYTVESALALLQGLDLFLAPRVLAAFFEAYAVVADQLSRAHGDEPIDQNALVDRCLGVAKQMWLQRELHSPESISRDLFRNALKLADNHGLLEPGGDVSERRLAFAERFNSVNRAIAWIRKLASDALRPGTPPTPGGGS